VTVFYIYTATSSFSFHIYPTLVVNDRIGLVLWKLLIRSDCGRIWISLDTSYPSHFFVSAVHPICSPSSQNSLLSNQLHFLSEFPHFIFLIWTNSAFLSCLNSNTSTRSSLRWTECTVIRAWCHLIHIPLLFSFSLSGSFLSINSK